uniref:SAP30 like n=1 Tax=Gasterosteus aculeatus aculeatus TaxID=481459 RepID=A0AAQ4R778_GASAC
DPATRAHFSSNFQRHRDTTSCVAFASVVCLFVKNIFYGLPVDDECFIGRSTGREPCGAKDSSSRPHILRWGGSFIPVRHLYICDFHKNFIQSVRNKRKRKTSDDGGDSPDHDVEVPEVDLFQLQVNTLRRYKRHYKLQTRPGLNKAQLAETVSRHFRNIPVNEKETLTYFIYMVKSSKSRLDQKGDGGKPLD